MNTGQLKPKIVTIRTPIHNYENYILFAVFLNQLNDEYNECSFQHLYDSIIKYSLMNWPQWGQIYT